MPFGKDGGLIPEFVGDGGVEGGEQCFTFFDEAANFFGTARGFAFVFVLLLTAAADGGEVGLEVGDEVGGQVVGDEFGGDAGLSEFLKEVVGGLDGGPLGVIAHFVGGAEAWLVLRNAAGGFGDGEQVDADFVDLALLFGRGWAGGGTGFGVVWADFCQETRQSCEGGLGLAGVGELGGVFAAEFLGAFEGVVDGVFVVCHMRICFWFLM